MSYFSIIANGGKKKESPKEITPPPAEPILKPIVSQPAAATPLSINENTKNFIRKMVAFHHFNEQELTQLLKSAVIKDDILKRIAAPSEGLPWHKYRKIFLTDARIEEHPINSSRFSYELRGLDRGMKASLQALQNSFEGTAMRPCNAHADATGLVKH